MEREQIREKLKSRAWLKFGGPGHEEEYVLNLEDHSLDNMIPNELGQRIKDGLGQDWSVANRGSRIEIIHEDPYGIRNDEQVVPVITGILAKDYDLKVIR